MSEQSIFKSAISYLPDAKTIVNLYPFNKSESHGISYIPNSEILKIGNTLNGIFNDSTNNNSNKFKIETPRLISVGTQSSGKIYILSLERERGQGRIEIKNSFSALHLLNGQPTKKIQFKMKN